MNTFVIPSFLSASLDVIMIHNVCGDVGWNMKNVQSIVLVMKNALMVARSLTMDILVTLGSVKALLNHVRQKMIRIAIVVLVIARKVVRH